MDPEKGEFRPEYDGNWVKNKQQGTGKMIYANGDIYEGEWEANNPHGKGVYTIYASKKRLEGTFDKGQFVQ